MLCFALDEIKVIITGELFMLKNISSGKINIRKKAFPEWLTYYIFLIPLIISVLIGFLGLPSFVKYSADLAWIILLVAVFFKKKMVIEKRLAVYIAFVVSIVVLWVTVYIFNYQSIFYFLWGIRNNLRFYVAFIAFWTFFSEDDANWCLKFLDVVFWINAAVSLFQFFALGYEQDYLGGVFGVDRGCNASSIIFFSIVLAISLIKYMEGKESALGCFSKCAFALLLAAMAELKVFFLVFVLVLILAALFTKFSWRKVLLIIVSAFFIMVASYVLVAVFGEGESLNIERIVELITATSYSSEEDLGRFTAIPLISKNFLTTLPEKLFGMGIGNCDTSAFEICNTPFFKANQNLHYTWFSSAHLFLETGYVGLAVYISFFAVCFAMALKSLRKKKGNPLFCQVSIIMSVLCVILTFYNSSLGTEIGYLAFFSLALHMIPSKGNPDVGETCENERSEATCGK